MRPGMSVNQKKITAFCEEHGILRLSLFGSVLREDFGPKSDVDVLVIFCPGRTPSFFKLFDLEDSLAEILGTEKVDLRTPEDLSSYFRDEVLRTARPLYDAA